MIPAITSSRPAWPSQRRNTLFLCQRDFLLSGNPMRQGEKQAQSLCGHIVSVESRRDLFQATAESTRQNVHLKIQRVPFAKRQARAPRGSARAPPREPHTSKPGRSGRAVSDTCPFRCRCGPSQTSRNRDVSAGLLEAPLPAITSWRLLCNSGSSYYPLFTGEKTEGSHLCHHSSALSKPLNLL